MMIAAGTNANAFRSDQVTARRFKREHRRQPIINGLVIVYRGAGQTFIRGRALGSDGVHRMLRTIVTPWAAALLSAVNGAGWGSKSVQRPVKLENVRTADEMRALRAGYSSVAQYEKAIAAKAKARRVN